MSPFEYLDTLGLMSLPIEAAHLLQKFDASPRLIAHLILVHDVAHQLIDELQKEWPNFLFDKDTILFGAATHDIGKIIHPKELSNSGYLHEPSGYELLIKENVPENLARFTKTHGYYKDNEDLNVEDLLVMLADKCWKGKRAETLEHHLVNKIAQVTNEEMWEVLIMFDNIVERVTSQAEQRLVWQAQFSVK